MNVPSFLPLGLGLIIFSFSITSVLMVPFIDLLYKLKLVRRKEAPKKGKVPLFDKLHDKKAGTPTGAGILLVIVITLTFAILFPLISYLGVYVESAHDLKTELVVIFFTFISFGMLGFMDDISKMFGKGRRGERPTGGISFGMSRFKKFVLQFIPALIVGYALYRYLGIDFVHVPFFDTDISLGFIYVPFAAFIIVFFTNAFNFTDGLDGLSCGLLLIYLFAFGVLAAINPNGLDTPISIFIGLWIGSLIAFLYFNVWPARISLGDTGALSFGSMIAVIGLLTGQVAPLFVIGGAFVLEAASSTIQILGWKFLKRPIFPVAPFHHALEAIGWEEPKIVMRAWLMGFILAIFGLWLATI